MGRGHQDIFAADIAWKTGSDPSIEYAGFSIDETDPHAPRIILSKFAPGARVVPHTHDTNYFEYIIQGSQTVGKVAFAAGDVRLVTGGTGYGPIIVGADGCTVIIMFQDGSRSMTEPLPRQRKAAEPVPA